MNDFENFQAVLELMLCDDIPGEQIVDGNRRRRLELWANEQAQRFGFTDWIAALHFTGTIHS